MLCCPTKHSLGYVLIFPEKTHRGMGDLRLLLHTGRAFQRLSEMYKTNIEWNNGGISEDAKYWARNTTMAFHHLSNNMDYTILLNKCIRLGRKHILFHCPVW